MIMRESTIAPPTKRTDDPFAALAWAIFEQAVSDARALVRGGGIVNGRATDRWPESVRIIKGYRCRQNAEIALYEHPGEVEELLRWLTKGEADELLADLGSGLSASRAAAAIVAEEAAQ